MKKFTIFFIIILFLPVLIFAQTMRDNTKTPISDHIELAISTGTVNRPFTYVVGFSSDCDYICDGTDDHVQINLAQTSLILSGGGAVSLREGIYDIRDDLATAIASTTIMGQGSATELRFSVDYKKFKLQHENCRLTNVRFNLLAGSCIAAEVSKSNCSVDNIWVDFVGDGNYAADISADIYNIGIRNIKMVSETANFVGIDLGSINPVLNNCVLENNVTPTSQSRAFLASSCSQGIISNCKAKGGFYRITNSTGVILEGNLIDFPGDSGISLIGINRDCIISDNYITSCVVSGITYTSGESSDFMIEGNRFENCTTGIALNSGLIRFQVQGNNFQGCGSETTGSATDLRMRLNIGKNGDWLVDDLVTTPETVSELFLTNEDAISSQYKLLTTTVPTGTQSAITASITTTDVIVSSFTTNAPLDITTFPEGIWSMHFHGYKSATTKVCRVYFTITKSTGSGETILFSSEESNPMTTSSESYIIHVATNEIIIASGDYITFRVYASVTGAGVNPTFTLEMEGSTASRLQFPALLPEVSVTKIIAGDNVTISPTSGKGEVTINLDDSISLKEINLTDGCTSAGKIKANAFEGDGSALTGISAGVTNPMTAVLDAGGYEIKNSTRIEANAFDIATKKVVVTSFSSTGINVAIDALGSDGGVVIMPEGEYTITSQIIIDYNNTSLIGCGNGTYLNASGFNSNGEYVILLNEKDYLHLANFQIEGNDGGGFTTGLISGPADTTHSVFENLYLHHSDSRAIYFYGSGISNYNTFTNCVIESCDTDGLVLHADYNHIINNKFISNGGIAIQLRYHATPGAPQYCVVSNNICIGNNVGIQEDANSDHNLITYNNCETNTTEYTLNGTSSTYVITKDGNIGIGSATAPTVSKLVVAGTITANGFVTQSMIYDGKNALLKIRTIDTSDKISVVDWKPVDHDTLPDGVRFETNYQKKWWKHSISKEKYAVVEYAIYKDTTTEIEYIKNNSTEELIEKKDLILIETTEKFIGRNLEASIELNRVAIKELYDLIKPLLPE